MGTNVDYLFRFGGSNQEKISDALGCVKEIQDENAQHNGNGDCDFSYEPHDVDDGLKQWHCFCDAFAGNPPNVLLDKLVPLTVGGDFYVWFYCYTDDGCYESSLLKYENGLCTRDGPQCNGILGIDGAIAAAELEERFDVKAALELVEIFLENCREGWYESCEDDDIEAGWNEEDLSCLCNAHLAALMLAIAAQHWPSLLSESGIQRRVAEINRKLDLVLDGVQTFDPFDYEPGSELILHEFKANLDAAELEQCTQPKSRRTASAATAHRI